MKLKNRNKSLQQTMQQMPKTDYLKGAHLRVTLSSAGYLAWMRTTIAVGVMAMQVTLAATTNIEILNRI